MLPPDIYVQRDAADPVLDPSTVLRMVRRHVPSARAVTAVDETGGEARAYMIDADVVLKTQRPQQLRARTSLEKEAFFLNALAGESDIRVPDVLGYGRDDDVEYTCMTRMPGVAARTLRIEGAARIELLRDVGRMLRRIHSLPQQPFYAHPHFHGPRTPEGFAELMRSGFQRAVEAIERDFTIWPLELAPGVLADRALAQIAGTTHIDLVALHSNPGPEHVFVDPSTLRFTGIIDFGDAYIAHPAFDMRWPRPEDRKALLAGYAEQGELDGAFQTAWHSSMVLAEMTAFAFRLERRESATALLQVLASEL